MKSFTLLLLFLLATTYLLGQSAPNAFNYSAVARNSAEQPISNTTIGIQISILSNFSTGNIVYSENHIVDTDIYGLFNLVIGSGAVQSGTMAGISWSNDDYFIKVGMDVNGGTNFLTMGTTQLLSVPYSMHSRTADSLIGGISETDPLFSNSVAAQITNADTANWNSKQNRVYAGAGISISGDTINALTQYQTLSIRNDTLFLTNGGFVKLPTGSGSSNNNYVHYIGEDFGGGVVFHLWKDNLGIEHGLIVDKVNLSTAQVWSNIDQIQIGATAQSVWNGLSNSIAIVAQAGHTNSAAALCLNSNNGGQSDWYLPSIQELHLLWTNYFDVAKKLSQLSGATQLSAANYWSSTEENATYAFRFYFGAGIPNSFTKNSPTPTWVRAIRAF
jgi:hypothetical protein